MKSNKNYTIIRNVLKKSFFLKIKDNIDKIINRHIVSNKIKINTNLSIDLKLLILEELNHKHISELYNKFSKIKFYKKFIQSKYLKNIIRSFLKIKNVESFTSIIRIDISNNKNWDLKFHQEASYVKHKKSAFVWFPIFNSNYSTNGGLKVIEKKISKHLPFELITPSNGQVQRNSIIPKKYSKYSKVINLNLGDILIFDKFLIHSSVINDTYRAKLSAVSSFVSND
jgi:hypothetical protein